jgi:hypothetical protein
MTIFFYKVHDPYGCFSNFSLHCVQLQGYIWPTSEHYYQAQKYWGTEYQDLYTQIRHAPTPEQAAFLGREKQYLLRHDWEQVKAQIMYEVVWTKFLHHQEIQRILLATGTELIIEDSPTDTYWGCGADRQGQNQLGKILMQVRDQLRYLVSQVHG